MYKCKYLQLMPRVLTFHSACNTYLSPCYDLRCSISVSGECFHVSLSDMVKYISFILIGLDKTIISAPDELVRYWVCGFVVKWEENSVVLKTPLLKCSSVFWIIHVVMMTSTLALADKNTDIIVIEMILIWWNELPTQAHTHIRYSYWKFRLSEMIRLWFSIILVIIYSYRWQFPYVFAENSTWSVNNTVYFYVCIHITGDLPLWNSLLCWCSPYAWGIQYHVDTLWMQLYRPFIVLSNHNSYQVFALLTC